MDALNQFEAVKNSECFLFLEPILMRDSSSHARKIEYAHKRLAALARLIAAALIVLHFAFNKFQMFQQNGHH